MRKVGAGTKRLRKPSIHAEMTLGMDGKSAINPDPAAPTALGMALAESVSSFCQLLNREIGPRLGTHDYNHSPPWTVRQQYVRGETAWLSVFKRIFSTARCRTAAFLIGRVNKCRSFRGRKIGGINHARLLCKNHRGQTRADDATAGERLAAGWKVRSGTS
jgi:hypothetical protein